VVVLVVGVAVVLLVVSRVVVLVVGVAVVLLVVSLVVVVVGLVMTSASPVSFNFVQFMSVL
jgi:hypothetical protein